VGSVDCEGTLPMIKRVNSSSDQLSGMLVANSGRPSLERAMRCLVLDSSRGPGVPGDSIKKSVVTLPTGSNIRLKNFNSWHSLIILPTPFTPPHRFHETAQLAPCGNSDRLRPSLRSAYDSNFRSARLILMTIVPRCCGVTNQSRRFPLNIPAA
jgi:hypothetical protein